MAKIIDQKGRIFGVINVIDFLVLFFLIYCVGIMFVGYKILKNSSIREAKNVPKAENVVKVSVQVKALGLDSDVSKSILVGDSLRDSYGKVIGKITAIKDITPDNVKASVMNVNDARKDLLIDMDILCDKDDNALYYKNQRRPDIKIGNILSFETDLYGTGGLIVGVKIDKDANEQTL